MAQVSYYLKGLPNGRTKAIFTVPEAMASTLSLHPVMCRGGVFRLEMDVAANKWMQAVSGSNRSEDMMGFLSSEFESPEPEATALAIAQRLESRIDDSTNTALSMSSYLGFL